MGFEIPQLNDESVRAVVLTSDKQSSHHDSMSCGLSQSSWPPLQPGTNRLQGMSFSYTRIQIEVLAPSTPEAKIP